jgi:hypothetical protein
VRGRRFPTHGGEFCISAGHLVKQRVDTSRGNRFHQGSHVRRGRFEPCRNFVFHRGGNFLGKFTVEFGDFRPLRS